jgi:hypothetical protein
MARVLFAVGVLVLVAIGLLGERSRGQMPGGAEPKLQPEVEAAKKFQAYAKTNAATYEMRAGAPDGRTLTLCESPLLRWSNPLGGRQAHGEVFLWTDDGRPAAVLSLYQWTGPDGAVHEHHEFCSLATGPLTTDGPGNRDWSPRAPGVALQPLDGAPPPGDSPRQRLVQMRELAAGFTAEKTTREDEKRALRLLPQPVLRYQSKLHDVADGALFAFVEATDPEVFLILEIRSAGGEPRWHYGLARMNSIRLAVSLGERLAWSVEMLPWSEALNRRDLPYTAFTIR